MNEIFGNDVLMEVFSTVAGDYVPFICCKDVSITFTPELINVTTVSSGKSNQYKARRYDYELSLNGISSILGSGRTVFTMAAPTNLLATHLVRLTFEDEAGDTAVFSCSALLKTLNITGNQDVFSDFSYSFQGSGVYTLVQQTVIPQIFSRQFSIQFA